MPDSKKREHQYTPVQGGDRTLTHKHDHTHLHEHSHSHEHSHGEVVHSHPHAHAHEHVHSHQHAHSQLHEGNVGVDVPSSEQHPHSDEVPGEEHMHDEFALAAHKQTP